MGSPNDEVERYKDEQLHTVTLTQPFYLGKYLVTQAEYMEATGKENPSYFSASGGGKEKVADMNTDQFPVETVSLIDAMKFCRNLEKKMRHGWWEARLPTEAEWEWACRASTTERFHVGNELGKVQANFAEKLGRTCQAPC